MTDRGKILKLAREVMGWETSRVTDDFVMRQFNPLVRISDAWMLVERMRELGWYFQFNLWVKKGCVARFSRWSDGEGVFINREADASTAPEAICNAAIRAFE